MYIRRKVFSIIEDENGEERLFSTTEFIEEETYLSQREFGRAQDRLNLTVGDREALNRARSGEAEYLNRMRNTANELKNGGSKNAQRRLDEIRGESSKRIKSIEDSLVKNSKKILDAEDKQVMGNKRYYQSKAKDLVNETTSKLRSVGEQVSSKIDTGKLKKGIGNFLKKVR